MNKAVRRKVTAMTAEQQKDAFQTVFADESGQTVLEILARAFYHYESAVTKSIVGGKVDSSLVLRINGMQDAFKLILSMLERETVDPVPGVPVQET